MCTVVTILQIKKSTSDSIFSASNYHTYMNTSLTKQNAKVTDLSIPKFTKLNLRQSQSLLE